MKNLNEVQNTKNNKSENETHLNHLAANLTTHLNLRVYNEMNDVTSSDVNVLELIQKQFAQINDLNHRRRFLLKEVSSYIVR